MGTCCSRHSPDPTHHLGKILNFYFRLIELVNLMRSYLFTYSISSWLQNTRYS